MPFGLIYRYTYNKGFAKNHAERQYKLLRKRVLYFLLVGTPCAYFYIVYYV